MRVRVIVSTSLPRHRTNLLSSAQMSLDNCLSTEGMHLICGVDQGVREPRPRLVVSPLPSDVSDDRHPLAKVAYRVDMLMATVNHLVCDFHEERGDSFRYATSMRKSKAKHEVV